MSSIHERDCIHLHFSSSLKSLIMAALRPPVPPRPHSAHQYSSPSDAPPPIPPLPPNFRPDVDTDTGIDSRFGYNAYDGAPAQQPPPPPFYPPPQIALDAGSGPHLTDPLVAPRPQRLTPDVPADVSLTSSFFSLLASSLLSLLALPSFSVRS